MMLLLFADSHIFYFTWLFSGASQNFDSILNRLALVYKYSDIADVAVFFKVDGSTVLFKAYI